MVTIEKTGEFFRLIYDVKGRFTIHRITAEEAKYKLCKVKKVSVGPKNVPFIVTHDGRTIRYHDPLVKVNDSIQLDIATGKMTDFIKFDNGELLNEVFTHYCIGIRDNGLYRSFSTAFTTSCCRSQMLAQSN